jgi:hypothetical protein
MGDLDRQVPFPGRGPPRPKDRDVARSNDLLLPLGLAFATHQHAPLAINHHEETVDGGTADHRGPIAKLAKEDAAAIGSAVAFRNDFAGRVDVEMFRSNTRRGRREAMAGDVPILIGIPLRSARILADVIAKKRDVTRPRREPPFCRTRAGFRNSVSTAVRAENGQESWLIRGDAIARVRNKLPGASRSACPGAMDRRRSWRRRSRPACGFRRRAFAGSRRRAL